MAGLLYFFPSAGLPIANPSKLPAECLLGSVLDGASFTHGMVARGPDGVSGCIISIEPAPGSGGEAARCGYYPDTQRWAKVCDQQGNATHWIGFKPADPPGPADLARPDQVDGHPVKLADRREWVIPAVHLPVTSLPRIFGADDAGALTLRVDRRYEALCRAGAKWHEIVSQQGKFTLEDWFAFAVDLLSVNYRLGRREVMELGLLNDSSGCLDGILGAAIGIADQLAEIESQKKMSGTAPVG